MKGGKEEEYENEDEEDEEDEEEQEEKEDSGDRLRRWRKKELCLEENWNRMRLKLTRSVSFEGGRVVRK